MNSTELAKIAKVSRSTVSRVLNNYPGVSPKMRERVEAAIREQNYVPDAAARKLAGKTNHIIGLFIIDTVDTYGENDICTTPFYNDYIALAINIANSRGYDLLIRVVRHQNADEVERLFQSGSISGGIIMGDCLIPSIIDRLILDGHKVVLYHQIPQSCSQNIITVNYNNFKCGKIAAEEFLRKGHRDLAMITGEKNKLCAMDRLDGFESALRTAQVQLDRERYVEYGEFHRQSGGYEAARKLLKRNRNHLPTGICAGSGTMMMGAMQAILDMGYRIPEDISLIGIDGIEIAKYTTPALTEVVISRRKVALTTVVRLIELIEGNQSDQLDFEVSEAELVQRDSVKDLSAALF